MNHPEVTSTRQFKFNPSFEAIWSKLYYQLTRIYPRETFTYDEDTETYWARISGSKIITQAGEIITI
jgi:hypothetical protein